MRSGTVDQATGTIPTMIATEALDPYRLPTGVRPTRYDVQLRPALESATFTGRVEITLTIDSDTDMLVLNAAELGIVSCAIDGIAAT